MPVIACTLFVGLKRAASIITGRPAPSPVAHDCRDNFQSRLGRSRWTRQVTKRLGVLALSEACLQL
eukprot:scaffold336353_cov20-Prasinocladus_malaysianus.AAC.1